MRGKLLLIEHLLNFVRITPAGAGKTLPVQPVGQLLWDHPRRCGENHCIIPHSNIKLGSPPQVRGKRMNKIKLMLSPRITPAGAGKTAHICPMLRQERDHPRRCGENIYSMEDIDSVLGSPPQVRGKPCYYYNRSAVDEDHPRRCGENR